MYTRFTFDIIQRQMNLQLIIYIMNLIIYLLATSLILYCQCTAVVFNGGQLTITGVVTNTNIDIQVTYKANVAWLGIIFSPDEISADVHIIKVNSSNSANPVTVKDCYLDQKSYIQIDTVQNIQPSFTGITSSVNDGLLVAYSRQLNTGDTNDITLYSNKIIILCFISSTVQFQGNGTEQNLGKVCSFFTLHSNVQPKQDRLLGNFGGTTTLNSNNLTVYMTQSTDNSGIESWLFMTLITQQQGLSSYSPTWLSVYYNNVTKIGDMALLQYDFNNITYSDYYFQSSANMPADDVSYLTKQGSNDVITIMGGVDLSNYFIASMKRKFSTGDLNRDTVITDHGITWCFDAGIPATVANGSALLILQNIYKTSDTQCIDMYLTTLPNYVFKSTATSSSSSNTANNSSSSTNTIVITADNLQIGRAWWGFGLKTSLTIFLFIIMLL